MKINEMKRHAAETAAKPKNQLQVVENERHRLDRIDEFRELTEANSLIRSKSYANKKGKSKGLRKFLNKRLAFMFEV